MSNATASIETITTAKNFVSKIENLADVIFKYAENMNSNDYLTSMNDISFLHRKVKEQEETITDLVELVKSLKATSVFKDQEKKRWVKKWNLTEHHNSKVCRNVGISKKNVLFQRKFDGDKKKIRLFLENLHHFTKFSTRNLPENVLKIYLKMRHNHTERDNLNMEVITDEEEALVKKYFYISKENLNNRCFAE